jgi:FemAB-related protein (PEP-CTERM system-associated)
MPVEFITPHDYLLWDAFVERHPHGTLYHKIKWKEVIEKSFGHQTFYLSALNNSTIRGVLPLISLNSRIFGKILCSMPFLNFGGIIADDRQATEELIEKAKELAVSLKTDFIELRHHYKSDYNFITNTHKVSMTIKLDKNPEVLWNNFSSKHRNELRKSFKSDLLFKAGKDELLDDFYFIISRGWRDLGTPIYSKTFFKNIIQQLGDNIEIVNIYYQDMPIATALNGLYKGIIEGMWTYALPEFRKLRTNYFLYWKMIERACEQGFNLYHLGRSTKDSNTMDFKSKWQAEPHQLYWDYILVNRDSLPEINVDNPKYRLLINTWRHLPVKLTQIIGPLFAKYIP